MNGRKVEKKILIATFTLLIILFSNPLLARVEAIDWLPATTQLTTDPGWDTGPSIMQTANGTIWVAWASDRVGWKNDIYYKTSNDNGASWTDDTQLTYDAEQDITPSIIQTADGTIWVVWASDRTDNFELYYTISINNGVSWAPDTQLTNNPTRDGGPSIMQHHNRTIWVIWHRDMGAGNYDLLCKIFNGTTWSPETRLTTDPSWDLNPSIIQAYNGTIWVVWTSYRTGDYEIFYTTSTDNGTSWSPETQLTTDSDFDEAPSITQARDGSLWIAWHSDRKGNQYDIYYTTLTNNGSTWSSDTQLTKNNADDMSPTIMNSHEGRMWVAWTSARIDDQFDLFYKTSDIIPITILGDIDDDGDVDSDDLYLFDEAYGSSVGEPAYNPDADIDGDGDVDPDDFYIIARNYGKSC